MMCRHCQVQPATRPRGLCNPHYNDRSIREQYETRFTVHTPSEIEDFYGRAKPCQPTDALPGTPEKFAVLCERARLGQELFHHLDARHLLDDSQRRQERYAKLRSDNPRVVRFLEVDESQVEGTPCLT